MKDRIQAITHRIHKAPHGSDQALLWQLIGRLEYQAEHGPESKSALAHLEYLAVAAERLAADAPSPA